ncbi:MAG: hypothetical protein JOZ75_00445 [Candidatus Dormibacteraeota bacterium]|nr:hypothetical protein [Candidatus Dormibacteraeota bacterium]
MPTYGYRCESCQQEFDVWQRMTDEPGAACPTCGGKGKRQFFPAGLVFKGSGFYVTDNRGSVPSSSSSSNGSSEGGSKTPKTPKPDTGSTSSGSKTGTSSGAASGSSTTE